MTDDLVTRLKSREALMREIGEIEIAFDWQRARDNLTARCSRILKLEGQRDVDAGLMAGMRAVIKQLEEQLRSANLSIAVLQGNATEAYDAGFSQAIEAASNHL